MQTIHDRRNFLASLAAAGAAGVLGQLRFYAIGLHEAGMIDASPNRIIAEGTDWRFVNDLKRELKA